MTNMAPLEPHTVNNRLIVEMYKKEALRSTEKSGFAFVAQKLSLKGLKLLVNAKLNDGSFVMKDSVVYVKEELLHTQAWAQKGMECDSIEGQFLIVDLIHVEFIKPKQTVSYMQGGEVITV